ncbi:MAG: ClbS/DfsB family four-helix bundle protein [Chloroflexota bacterium]
MNKSELIKKISEGRSSLEICSARIDPGKMELIILHGEWSIKDMIGHLGFWEDRIALLFEILKSGNAPEPMENMDQVNQQSVIDFHDKSLSEIVNFEKAAYLQLLNLINNSSEIELFDPNHFQWTEGRQFAEIILDNTTGHYEEHIPEITAWEKRIA